MKKDFSVLFAFLLEKTGLPEAEWVTQACSPSDLLEALWPLNDVFRPKMSRLQTLRYSPRFETEADDAVIAFASSPIAATWEGLTSGAWRVLAERHLQMLVVCTANMAAGEAAMWFIPQQLPAGDRTAAAVLEWLYGMTLPWPPRAPGSLELPASTHPGSMQLQ